MRYIDYLSAQRLCVHLVPLLQNTLGEAISYSRFVAMPRGGFFVLGMLSYMLNLTNEQLLPEKDRSENETPLVIVDDCCLSGRRFASFLENISSSHIIFAHLLSHPHLRQAILESELRVRACLAGDDLQLLPEDSASQQVESAATWQQRLPGQRYWLGAVEPFTFSWSEPDTTIWNERQQKVEVWHRASPRLCLDTLVALQLPLVDIAPGPLDIPAAIRWQIKEDEVLIWHTPSGKVFGLKGAAGEMWRSLAAYGSQEQAYQYLLKRYPEAEQELLQHDLSIFTQELLAKDLLTTSPS